MSGRKQLKTLSMSDDGSIGPARVLVVEDHEAFRRFIRLKLRDQHNLLLLGETGNGLDAVSRCLELQPSLVLMDIGLPGLNGLEAGRRILALVPGCKIIFLTQERSSDIVREALNLGASGYVIKADAATDLLPAIIAAQNGRQFVSKTVELRRSASDAKTNHPAHFHPDESSLLAAFIGFIEDALRSGNAVIAITTRPHRKQILQSLQQRGLDLASLMDERRFVSLDVDETLAKFMVDDWPDPARFFEIAGGLVREVKAMHQNVRVLGCGEIAPTLWARGNGPAAVQVEHLWDQLVRIYDLESHCGYILTGSQRKGEIYDGICAAHSSICSF